VLKSAHKIEKERLFEEKFLYAMHNDIRVFAPKYRILQMKY
jgi:hypothetical protein